MIVFLIFILFLFLNIGLVIFMDQVQAIPLSNSLKILMLPLDMMGGIEYLLFWLFVAIMFLYHWNIRKKVDKNV
jgi:hypothetical protein